MRLRGSTIESSRVACRACALTIALSCILLAQSPDRDQRFRDDLTYLANELPARHANAFHTTSRAQFNTAVDALSRDIPLLGDTEIMVRMAQIVASIGDSHTSLPLPQGRAPFPRFPFTFFGFEDGWRINAVGPELAQLLGCRIVRIGDTPIEEVYTRVASVISHENDAWVKQQFPSYARWADILKAVGIIASLDSAHWTFETLGAEQFSLDIAPISQQSSIAAIGLPDSQGFTPLYRQNTTQNYWYAYIGGFSNVINPFLADLQARQARFASGTKKIVIIGRRTASSAMLNAISLKQQPYSVLIGEPTGGKPNSYGEVQTLTLPDSGATVNYATKLIDSPITTQSVLPDRSIPFYSRDYFARHDPFLAAALADVAPVSTPPGDSPLVNSATFRPGPMAPGSLATLFLSLQGLTSEVSSYPSPAKLAGVEVQFDDKAAGLLAVTPGQINLQVPLGLAPGTVNLRVVRDGVEVLSAVAQIASSSPALFLADLARGDQPGAVLNQDSRLNTSQRRARRAEVIQIFATGAGPVEAGIGVGVPPQTITTPRVFVASEIAVVTYSGISPQFPGVWQINVRLPDAPSVAKQVPVFVIGDDGTVSNAVTVWVEE
ncbi:MAG: hypothetical protein HY235_03075 [Acidobacteria bacterium]|nr:hypothetical protein [Acidobacteriota bacterium]